MEEDVKIPNINDVKKELINITLPYKWGEEIYFMDNNSVHQGKIAGFTCHGQFNSVFIISYDIVETNGNFGRNIEIDSEFIYSSKEEIIKKLFG